MSQYDMFNVINSQNRLIMLLRTLGLGFIYIFKQQ